MSQQGDILRITGRGQVDWTLDTATAWQAFEQIVLSAGLSIKAAFKRFDLTAPLGSSAARAVGRDWGDLLRDALRRGVDVTLWLAAATSTAEEIAALEAFSLEIAGRGTAGRFRLIVAAHPARAAAHRQNLAVVDGRTLFLARLGLTPERTLPGERDLSIIARGPAAAEAERLLDGFEAICRGERPPPPARRILRTLSRPAPWLSGLRAPQTTADEFENAHRVLARRAERLIYIETHAFDSPELARALAERAQARPDLRLVLIRSTAGTDASAVPPAGPAAEARRDRCLSALRAAFGARMFCGLAPGGCANASIFDAEAALTGSADLGRAALRRDTGAGFYLRRSDGIEALRLQMMRRWLPDLVCGVDDASGALLSAFVAAARANSAAGRTDAGALLPAADPA